MILVGLVERNGLLQKKEAFQLPRNQRVEVVGWRSILPKKEALQLQRNPRVEVAAQRSILQNNKTMQLPRNPRVEVDGHPSILKNSFLPCPQGARVTGLQGHHLLETIEFIHLAVEVILQVTNLPRYGMVIREPQCLKGQPGQIIIDIQHQGLATLVVMGMVEITTGGSDHAYAALCPL